ncbi:MAG TPA: hypothetical protein VE890_09540, partial [Thermoguttaceae bacterium]|nr:hypothetical protein [Thermoguttaceae bacterium]
MFTMRRSSCPSRQEGGRRRPLSVRRHCLVERLEDRCLLSGVTMLTHGHWGNAATGGWIDHMASAMAEEAIAAGMQDVAIYAMTVEDAGNGTLAVQTPIRESGPASWEEAIIKVDWSELSTGIFSSTPTGDVADAIAWYVLTQPIDNRLLVESPIHLVGHSRGASLQSVLAGRLGQQGIWVDQLTTLDPHPVDGLGGDDFMNYGDAPMRVWPNIRFADNYWREDADPTDFDGEAIAGAFNRHLSEDILGEGVFPDVGFGAEHSDVHLWYHGTIDTTGPVDDGEVEIPITDDDGWYEGNMGPRDAIGFHFSRIAAGVRPSQGLAAAGAYRDPLSLTVAG